MTVSNSLRNAASLFSLLVLAACVANPVAREATSFELTAAERPGAGRLYFAGQPDATGLAKVADAGIGIVINLRYSNETDWDEAAVASQAGLRYYQVPVSRDGPGFDKVALDTVTSIIEGNPDSDILLHCSSGNRVSAWYAIYLVQHVGLTPDQALSKARLTGLTSESLQQRIEYYLGQTQN